MKNKIVAFLCGAMMNIAVAEQKIDQSKSTLEKCLREAAWPKEVIELFLKGKGSRMKFDSELGYIPNNFDPKKSGIYFRDGIGGSEVVYTMQASGARTSFMYSNKKPRINTYGDSFTQSTMVNDGETWQEYLAGHLREPIANFGVGGFGVYQAYRRMIREENTEHNAEYVVLYVWGDDSTRSLLKSRAAMSCAWKAGYNLAEEVKKMGDPELAMAALFEGNPWAHIEMDTNTGKFIEIENPLSSHDLLFRMSDPKWMYDNLKGDLALQLVLFKNGAISEMELNHEEINKLAGWLGVKMDWESKETLEAQAEVLLDRYSTRGTQFVLEKARAYAAKNRKNLMVVLNDTWRLLPDMVTGRGRFDQELVDYLKREKFYYFDMNEVNLSDFRKSGLNPNEYLKSYAEKYVTSGHYSPQGNHFFAYSIKDKFLEWLSLSENSQKNASN